MEEEGAVWGIQPDLRQASAETKPHWPPRFLFQGRWEGLLNKEGFSGEMCEVKDVVQHAQLFSVFLVLSSQPPPLPTPSSAQLLLRGPGPQPQPACCLLKASLSSQPYQVKDILAQSLEEVIRWARSTLLVKGPETSVVLLA